MYSHYWQIERLNKVKGGMMGGKEEKEVNGDGWMNKNRGLKKINKSIQ